MLVLSDMSGPSMVPGFETYITAYSLPEEEAVAVARTWYADEMTRPGCVWTHTLLVRWDDISRIRDVRQLNLMFRRPELHADTRWEIYRRPLELGTDEYDEPASPANRETVLQHLLAALYEADEPVVLVPADTSASFEDAIFRIWNQQWSELRRSFGFCSGALAIRELDGRPLDLQVVPRGRTEQIRRQVAGAEARVVEVVEPSIISEVEWARLAARELSGSGTKMRDFLARYAEDLDARRSSFGRLADLFVRWNRLADGGQPEVGDLVTCIAHLFPTARDGQNVKAGLLWREVPERLEAVVLEELCTRPGPKTFDSALLAIEQRAGMLWRQKPAVARRILLRISHGHATAIGRTFARGIAKVVERDELISVSVEAPEALLLVVEENWRLAATPELWSKRGTVQDIMLDVISNQRKLTGHFGAIVGAMMVSEDHSLPQRAREALGKELTSEVLNQLNSGRFDTKEVEGWLRLLEEHPRDVLAWFEMAEPIGCQVIELLPRLLSQHRGVLTAEATGPFLRIVESASKCSDSVVARVAALGLAIAFSSPDQRADELAAATFQRVHDAFQEGSLGNKEWRWIEPYTRPPGWFQQADRGDMVRRALIDRFLMQGWRSDVFIRAFGKLETFRLALEAVRYSAIGREARFRLGKLAEAGEVKSNNEVTNAILDEIRSWSGRGRPW